MAVAPHDVRGRFGIGWIIAAVLLFAAVIAAVIAVVVWQQRNDDDGDLRANEAQLDVPAVAPAFTSEQLAQQPAGWWVTNGGNLSNQRYSPLAEIDTGNVGDLKGVWRTHLGAGMQTKHSGEAQPIYYNGTVYVINGDDDVYAIDVENGDLRWVYRAELDQGIRTVCCDWTSRGVPATGTRSCGRSSGTTRATGTLVTGGGLAFVGRNDGQFQAYDAENGDELWSFQTGAGPTRRRPPSSTRAGSTSSFDAAGNSLIGSAHGDNVWLFGLDCELDEAEGPDTGQGTGEDGGEGGEAKTTDDGAGGGDPNQLTGNPDAGAAVFEANCASCHGNLGQGATSARTSRRCRRRERRRDHRARPLGQRPDAVVPGNALLAGDRGRRRVRAAADRDARGLATRRPRGLAPSARRPA